MKLFFENTQTLNEGRNAESITEEVWDNTTSKALSNAFDRDLLSIFRDGGVFWIESRGCPDREYKIAIRETKRIFPNLEYLYDLPTSRNDNYALREKYSTKEGEEKKLYCFSNMNNGR